MFVGKVEIKDGGFFDASILTGQCEFNFSV